MGPIPTAIVPTCTDLSRLFAETICLVHTANMDIEAVIKHFGSVKALAKALDVYPQVIYQWKANGIPLLRQYQIQVTTNGQFMADGMEAAASEQ